MTNWLRVCASIRIRTKDDSGQALVELALSASLLFLILLGAVEFARATYAAIEVSNAARAAAQYGAANGGNTGDTTGMQNAAQADSFNLGTTVTLNGTPTVVNSCSDGGTYSATTGCGNNAHVMTLLTVRTQATFSPLIHFAGLPTTFNLYGFAQQQVMGL